MMKICLLILFLGGLMTATHVCGQTVAIGAPEDYTRERMMALWQAETRGRNLAAGREVLYAPSPDYHLTTKGGTDTRDLTDGKLGESPEQLIWWEPPSVAWGSTGTRKIIVDFGQAETVSHVVWRVVAGSHFRGFMGPKQVKVYGSLDGETAFLISERHRWSEDNARPDSYRIPNIGLPSTGEDVYVYPIRLDVRNYRLRYLIVQFVQDSVWFATDELAVIAGEGGGTPMDALPGEQLQTKDVWITADDHTVPVASDVKLPMWFRQTDLRPAGGDPAVAYEFQLPPGVSLDLAEYHYQVTREGDRVTVQSARGGNSTEIGPFFLTAGDEIGTDAVVRFRAVGSDAEAQPWHELALQPVAFPEPFVLQKLTTSIGWMVDAQRAQWPDFAASYRRIGFNTVPSFPRAWEPRTRADGLTTQQLEDAVDPASLTPEGQSIAALRAQGFKTIYMESPLHVVNWQYRDAAEDYRCVGPITDIESFCPSYRGPYYTAEMERLRRCYLLMGGADYVIWDVELLGSSKWKSPVCSRCIAAKAASGDMDTDWTPFLTKQSTAMLRDMNAEIHRETRNHWPTPPIGMYSVDTTTLYSELLKFPCDGLFDFQNTSLYAGDYPEQIHSVIRDARSHVETNNIIPWLSTNTGGRVTPVNARIIVWETLLNGAIGFTYFTFSDLSPQHMVEISRALSQVAPVEDIIYHGKPAWSEFTLTAGSARLSATRVGTQCVLLLVNTTDAEQTIAWRHSSGVAGQDTIPAGEAILQEVTLK